MRRSAQSAIWNRAGGITTAPAQSRPWYHIVNLAGAESAQLWIYDEIGAFGTPAAALLKDLSQIRARSIDVHVNSPGGEVFDGMAIYSALRQHPAQVHVVIDGLAASIATVIAMAGDTVRIAPNATMMIHESHMVAIGDSAEMLKAAQMLDKTSANIASIYAERTGQSVDAWRGRMKAETWYNATEAVKAGLADEIMTAPERAPAGVKVGNRWDLGAVYNFAGRDDPRYAGPDVAPSNVAPSAVPPMTPAEPPLVEFDPSAITAAFAGIGEAVKAAIHPPDLTFDPDVFRQAMEDVRTSRPVPPSSTPTAVEPSEPPAPIFGFDPDEFARAIREGRTP